MGGRSLLEEIYYYTIQKVKPINNKEEFPLSNLGHQLLPTRQHRLLPKRDIPIGVPGCLFSDNLRLVVIIYANYCTVPIPVSIVRQIIMFVVQ